RVGHADDAHGHELVVGWPEQRRAGLGQRARGRLGPVAHGGRDPRGRAARSTSVAPVGRAAGETKRGVALAGFDSATAGPPTCVHANVSASPSGSLLPPPCSETTLPSSTVRSPPASAIGTWLRL